MTALYAFSFSLVLFLALCLVLHITPFGDRTFLYEDMKQQYVDFFSYYHNVWHGKDGFLYSENCGLGAEMFGIWAYYLTSPFLLMFIFIPEQYYATAVTFLIMLKMASIAFCMSLFLSHVGRRADERCGFGSVLLNLQISVAFAFCGWTVANMTNIMWLDAVIMLPIVAMGFDKLIHHEKRGTLLYVLSVMVMIFVNYYIAAMVLIFLGVFAVLWVLFGKADTLKGFGRFLIGSAIAIALDVWFLVPTVMSLMGSNKDHSGPMMEAFQKYLPSSEAVGRYLSPLDVLPKLFTMSYDTMEIMDGMPNIYFGAVLIMPCVLFFLTSKISVKVRALFGSYLVIVLAFFCIKPLNTLAHGGTEAYGYLYRYSFVFSFVCLTMAYLAMCQRKNHQGKIHPGKIAIAGVITLALYGVASLSHVRFLGGKVLFLNLLLILAGGAAVVIWGCFYRENEPVQKAGLTALLVMGLVLAADLSLNFICVYRNSSMNGETASRNRMKCIQTEAALRIIRDREAENGEVLTDSEKTGGSKAEADNGNYRIESLSPRTPNESLHFGYRGTTTYNSLLKVENRLFMYRLGFNDNGLYTMYDNWNTSCADAILGIKYHINDSSTHNVITNEYALSADLITDKTIPGLMEIIEPAANPFEAQELLWNHFTDAEDEVFIKATCEPADGEFEFLVTPNLDGELYFYMNREGTNERSLEIRLEGESLCGYGNASCQKVVDLGYHKAGEKLHLVIVDNDNLGYLPDEPVVVTEDLEILKKK
ncbi:YfhO family protein [Butyrivibrio sp. AD3002]|uniref:YfhO family protein n=1 Tax=Butyrivibrio sp. AD3002 TaxID=1280670 RepID=UPI0003B6CB2E|nr:YfhO family protein [Butyrivibrio sp. AD3002]